VGEVGAEFQRQALEFKQAGNYFGLLLDGVDPPEVVRAAQDILLADWGVKPEQSRLSPLLTVLQDRLRKKPEHTSPIAEILARLGSVTRVLSLMDKRLRRVLEVVSFTSLVAVFGLIAGWNTFRDTICDWGATRTICRALGATVPTAQETSEWNRIRAGSDCNAFGVFLNQYGPKSTYAPLANQRLALPKEVSVYVPRAVAMRRDISWAGVTRRPTRAAAIEDLNSRIELAAKEHCESNAQAFAGLVAPGRFVADADPDCDTNSEGSVCRSTGRVICTFREIGYAKICPTK